MAQTERESPFNLIAFKLTRQFEWTVWDVEYPLNLTQFSQPCIYADLDARVIDQLFPPRDEPRLYDSAKNDAIESHRRSRLSLRRLIA